MNVRDEDPELKALRKKAQLYTLELDNTIKFIANQKLSKELKESLKQNQVHENGQPKLEKTKFESTKKIGQEWSKVDGERDEVLKLVNDIHNYLIKTDQPEVQDEALKYFLNKVARYNGYFMRFQELTEDGKPIKLVPDIGGTRVDYLKKAGFSAIKHPLLGSAQNTNFTYRVKRWREGEPGFRPAHILKNYEGKDRRVYNKKCADPNFCQHDGKPYDYIQGYRKKNLFIGGLTQYKEFGNSNLYNAFAKEGLSRLMHSFMRGAHIRSHKQEKKIFRAAQYNLEHGIDLTAEQKEVCRNGRFYRWTGSALRFVRIDKKDANYIPDVHAVGHATTVESTPTIAISDDIVNYQSGVQVADQFGYPRKTDPSMPTKDHPPGVRRTSHKHHDHADQRSTMETSEEMTMLNIVPPGDENLFESWDQEHVIGLDWNDKLEISCVDDDIGEPVPTVVMDTLPSNHASNRELKTSQPDLNVAGFNGWSTELSNVDHIVITRGDTGLYDEEHWDQVLEKMLRSNKIVRVNKTPGGPDRPRDPLSISHESSMDSVSDVMRLVFFNAIIFAARRTAQELKDKDTTGVYSKMTITAIVSKMDIKDIKVTQEDYQKAFESCAGILYHVGCFRLGLISYNDAQCSIGRALLTLSQYSDMPIGDIINLLEAENKILKELNKDPSSKEKSKINDYYFGQMDQFERDGLLDALKEFNKFHTEFGLNVTGNDISDCIRKNVSVIVNGQTYNFNDKNKQYGFEDDFQYLIINRDPTLTDKRAYERLTEQLCKKINKSNDPETALANFDKLTSDPFAIVEEMLRAYADVKFDWGMTTENEEQKKARQFLAKFSEIKNRIINDPACKSSKEKANALKKELLVLRGEMVGWKTYDESQRPEGHNETALLMIVGLLDNPEFQKKFKNDYLKINQRYGHIKIVEPIRAVTQEEFLIAKTAIVDTIAQWLDKANKDTLDRESRYLDSPENDKKRAVELIKEFGKISDAFTLINRLADFMVTGKTASDSVTGLSRFDVRNSLNNTLAKQFFPQAFLPEEKDSKKDVYSPAHTKKALMGFALVGKLAGRTELAYTPEELAKKLREGLFPAPKEALLPPAADTVTRKRADATSAFFSPTSSANSVSSKALDDKGKGKDRDKDEKSSVSLRNSDSESS